MLRTDRRSFALLLIGCASTLHAQAASYVVNTVSDGSLARHCNGASGACSLRDAMTLANKFSDESVITFDAAVFATPQSIVLSQPLPETITNLTIAGPATPLTISGNNQFLVMSVNPGATLKLSSLTIASGSGVNSNGGGILNSGTLTVTNCVFSDNSAYNGGGIFNEGTLSISNSYFVSNSATISGGGIYNYATLTIDGTTFSTNSGRSGGGAIGSDAGTVTLTNDKLEGNSAPYGDGGAVLSSNNSTLTIANSTISGNSSGLGGGIATGGPFVLTGSTVSSNSSSSSGGGIDNGGPMTVSNSTIANNSTAEGGGGIQSDAGRVELINTTVSGNTSTLGAGGIDITDAQLSLMNTIVANNSRSDCHKYPDAASSITAQASLDDDESCVAAGKSGNLTAPPHLGPLQDNGGPTQTMAIGTSSPAYNAGHNGLAGGGVIHDQRGASFVRKYDGTVDIGAYEVQPDFSVSVDPVSQTVPVGGVATYTVSIARIDGFTGPVKLQFAGQPTSTVSACHPNPVSEATTCTLSTPNASLPGNYSITISGTYLNRIHSSITTLTLE